MSGNFKNVEIDYTRAEKVPIALFVGKEDQFSTVEDTRGIRDALEKTLVHYEEIDGSRTTFLIGKSMSYFSQGVMRLLDAFHPVEINKRTATIDEYRPFARI